MSQYNKIIILIHRHLSFPLFFFLTFVSFECFQILDTNPKLYFHLQQQRLIEYIRQGRISEALEFAQDELAPLGEENVGHNSNRYIC